MRSTTPTASAAASQAAGTRREGPALLVTVAAAVIVTLLVPLAALLSDGRVAEADLLRDPAALTGAPWYLGALTWVNVMVWAAAAALYLLAGTALRSTRAQLGAAMAWLGAITVALALDDAFLLHEVVLPEVLGIPEVVTFGVYGAAALAVLLRYRAALLRQPEVSLLALALVALGGSVLIDVVGGTTTAARLAEDGLKLLGALAWAVFPARVIVRSLSGAPPVAASR